MLGELAIKDNDLQDAIENLSISNELQPQPIARLSQRLALLKFKTGDLNEALEECNKAILFNSDDYKNYIICGNIEESRDNQIKALEYYQSAILKAPALDEPIVSKASLLYRQNKKIEAKELLINFLKANIDSALVYGLLGRLSFELKDTNQAKEYLLKSWELSKVDLSIAEDLIKIYLSENDFDRSITLFKELLQINPKNIELKRKLAQVFYQVGRFDSAISELKEILELNPSNIDIKYELALIYLRIKSNLKCYELLIEILGVNSERSDVRFTLANLYASQKQFSQSLDQIQKIKETDLEYFRAQVLKSLIIAEQGNKDYSIELIDNVINSDKKDKSLSNDYLIDLRKSIINSK